MLVFADHVGVGVCVLVLADHVGVDVCACVCRSFWCMCVWLCLQIIFVEVCVIVFADHVSRGVCAVVCRSCWCDIASECTYVCVCVLLTDQSHAPVRAGVELTVKLIGTPCHPR